MEKFHYNLNTAFIKFPSIEILCVAEQLLQYWGLQNEIFAVSFLCILSSDFAGRTQAATSRPTGCTSERKNTVGLSRWCCPVPYIGDYITNRSFERPKRTEKTAANDRYPLRPISGRRPAARLAVSYRRLRIDNLRFLSGRRAEIIGESGGNYLTTGYAGLQSHRKAPSLTVSVTVEPFLGDKSGSQFNGFSVFRVQIEPK